MKVPRLLILALIVLRAAPFLVAGSAPAVASPSDRPDPVTPSDLEIGTLVIGQTTFHDVRVKARDARSLVFIHRDGLASVRLRDLPSETQIRIGYDPASAPVDSPVPPARIDTDAAASGATARVLSNHTPASSTAPMEQLVLSYDLPPEFRARQTLQPEFIRLNLAVKNQGRRPSCAIYAIVSALEFQNARITGDHEKLSEEYLLWATRRSLGRNGPAALVPRDTEGQPVADIGYTLPSVVAALQTFGIPRQDDMPNQPGRAPEDVPEPDSALVAKARGRRLVFISQLPGGEPAGRLKSLVHALNAGFPVPAGLLWPNERTIRAGVLSAQPPLPGGAHAVTFIGYECPSGRPEDAFFVFKNSYGPRWGQGGYGRASWGYLSRNLLEAYVLDVRFPARAP